jgi:hypothetical protein
MGLNIDQQTAKRVYFESPEWFKRQLEEAFGKESFKKLSYKDIKTFDDACRACGTTEEEFNEKFQNLGQDTDTIFYEKLKIVVKSINQEWTADWNNTNQRKWYPWFNLSSGFGFVVSGCVYGCAFTGVGSRLCYESEDKSNYAAKQFIDIYEQFITIKN